MKNHSIKLLTTIFIKITVIIFPLQEMSTKNPVKPYSLVKCLNLIQYVTQFLIRVIGNSHNNSKCKSTCNHIFSISTSPARSCLQQN